MGGPGRRAGASTWAIGDQEPARPSPHADAGVRWWTRHPDLAGVGVLAALTAIVGWNRLAFDQWMSRVDILTFYLPWYAFLGERLRAFDIPGWNPYLFSGTPFAGDPQSGWMFLPAMITFPFLSAVAAFKAMVAIQLAIASLSTYAYARVLRLGVVASLVAAVVFAFGPFLQHDTYCCTVYAQLAMWIPLALLGVELSLRAETWRGRVAAWFVAGFAISQMLAGWLGQGAMYALLLVATYLAYRALLSPPRSGRSLHARRFGWGAATGAAILALGLALGAAGLLPRLLANRETNLAGGNYGDLGAASGDYPPWTLHELLAQVTGGGFAQRVASFGAVAIVLSLLAPVVARRRFAVPFFFVQTLIVVVLTQATTPIHRLFYLIPRFQVIHEHEPDRTIAVAMIGPAIMAGAVVERLPAYRGRRRLAPILLAPMLLLALLAWQDHGELGATVWPPLVAAMVVTALLLVVCVIPRPTSPGGARRPMVRFAPILVLTVAFIQPTGLELVGSITGRSVDPGWLTQWQPQPILAAAVATNVATVNPGGAGAFLQARQAGQPPFRYVGYGGISYPNTPLTYVNYQTRRTDIPIQAILVNARAMRLGLYDIQGYNPVQLERYVEFLDALNSGAQNYHTANLLPTGVASPMLDLLGVRYILLDRTLPPDRPDVRALVAGRTEVFRNANVIVYRNDAALPHAWIVHDVRAVTQGDALPMLASGAIDPRRTALVEGAVPAASPPPANAREAATVSRYEPDAVTIDVEAASDGLLVVSDIYAAGWSAEVDGKRVEILPTDHALRGVPVTAGVHVVTMRYDPPQLRLGLAISAASTIAMLISLGLAAWRAARPGARASSSQPRG